MPTDRDITAAIYTELFNGVSGTPEFVGVIAKRVHMHAGKAALMLRDLNNAGRIKHRGINGKSAYWREDLATPEPKV